MSSVECHQLVGKMLTMLAGSLGTFGAQVLNRSLPPGTDWADLLKAKDAANGRGGGEYQNRDLALMLRAMTERLGERGYPFSKASRQVEIQT